MTTFAQFLSDRKNPDDFRVHGLGKITQAQVLAALSPDDAAYVLQCQASDTPLDKKEAARIAKLITSALKK